MENFVHNMGGLHLTRWKNIILEQESAVVENDTCASSLPETTVRRTIGKTTYIVNLHFKKQGQPFSEKLKRVLKAESNTIP